MKRKFKFFRFLFIFSMIIVLAACGSSDSESSSSEADESSGGDSEETIKLTYAFFAPDTTFPAVQMKEWAERLSEKTDGKVEVEMFFSGSLLDASNMFEGVLQGTADIGLTATTYEPGRFPLLEISDLPSGYPSSEVASQVFFDLLHEYTPDELENFKIVTAFATEPSFIMSIDRIGSLEELKGKQLRISGGLTPVMEALGAAPVGMSQAEVPEAIQTGIIEGNISSREVLEDFKLYEYVDYVTDFPLTVTSFVAVMNKDVWDSLPADVQEAIDELSKEMSIFTGQYLDSYVAEVMEDSVANHGVEVVSLSEEEEQKWTELIQGIQDEQVEKANDMGLPGTEYKERLYELLDQYTQ